MTNFDDKRSSEKLSRKVLGDPTLYPDEFKAWLPRWLATNINFQVGAAQLPAVESYKAVGGTGNAAFAGTWVNYGGGFSSAGYYKDPFGVVHLRGLVKSGAIGTVFILPVSYRPQEIEIFATISNGAAAECRVSPDGTVVAYAGSSVWYSLAGITFRAYA